MANTAFDPNYILTGKAGGSNSIQDFRLTLASNTPVMSTEVLAATTLYLTPYVGNKIALYNGSTWDVVESAEINTSLATISADTNYDVFAYNSSGTVMLELLAWTSNGAGTSARATELAYQNGVLVKSGATTRRYIGTIRGSASGQCQFSFGGIDIGGVHAKLFVWNYNNRIMHSAKVGESTDNWSYSAITAWRVVNNSSNYRVSFVCGLAEDQIQSSYTVCAYTNNSAASAGAGVGLNSTSTFSGVIGLLNVGPSTLQGKYEGVCSTGFNYVQALELNGSGISNFLGDSGNSALHQLSALQFSFMM